MAKIDYEAVDRAVKNLPDCAVKSDDCEQTAEYKIGLGNKAVTPICRICIPDWVYENLEMGAEEEAKIEAIIRLRDFTKGEQGG